MIRAGDAEGPINSSFARRLGSRERWLLSACAILFTGVPMCVARVDAELRGEADPILGEIPADKGAPFDGTRSEMLLKRLYREPDEPSALPSTALGQSAPATRSDPSISPEALKKARKIYAERCASCHGEKGDGDGPGAYAIKPKPRDYTDPEWQKTITDEELAKAIVKGGAAVGKSYMMPANYDLRSKPEVTAALVALVRSFAQK